VSHPFRFTAALPALVRSPERWKDEIRRVEDLGFSSVCVSQHLAGGWVLDPLVSMLAAAEATRELRVLSLVLANDFFHPALLHKSLALIDVLSGGRLEIGLGSGWLAGDYQALGLKMDPPADRVSRLEEAVRVLKGLFAPEPLRFEGRHYRVELDGLPKPVQRPHPPLLIGGGGRRVLQLAAREADMVGIHCRLREAEVGPAAVHDLSADRIAEKARWVREAAREAGRDPDQLEFQFSVYLCHITDSRSARSASVSSFSRLLQGDPELLRTSPAVLCGSLEECVDLLLERRERFGLSYIKLGGELEATAPLVARLAGR
jgi:probable F420-dependent oxidoreductase